MQVVHDYSGPIGNKNRGPLAPRRRQMVFRGRIAAMHCLLLSAALTGCAPMGVDEYQAESEMGAQGEAIVYGKDDRDEVYQHPSSSRTRLVRSATVALVRRDNVDDSDPKNIKLRGPRLGRTICSDERFVEQRQAAFCGGTLIADDLVLTAGHCLNSFFDCRETRFVFDFYVTGPNRYQRIQKRDVFECADLVTTGTEPYEDYAIVRLDRRTGRSPARVRRRNKRLSVGEQVWLAGNPSGLPIKIAAGAQVKRLYPIHFQTNLDAFKSNSGSGVFLARSNVLVGIHVRGPVGYQYDAKRNCNRVRVCKNNLSNCHAPAASYARDAVELFCFRRPRHAFCR